MNIGKNAKELSILTVYKRKREIIFHIQRLAAQLAVINREGIRSIGEVEGKAEAYRAECRRIAGEIEKLDKYRYDS